MITEKLNTKEELPFTGDKGKNIELLIDWMRRRIWSVCEKNGIERKDSQWYNVTAVYVSTENNEHISKHLGAFDFLTFSPSEDSNLANDEISFNLDNIIEGE